MTTAAEALISVPMKSSSTLTSMRKTMGLSVRVAKLRASMCGTWALVRIQPNRLAAPTTNMIMVVL